MPVIKLKHEDFIRFSMRIILVSGQNFASGGQNFVIGGQIFAS
jgi:hypothetical protein